MTITRHSIIPTALGLLVGIGATATPIQAAETQAEPTRYVRFHTGERIAYGVLEEDRIRELEGDLFGEHTETDRTYPLENVTLLPPTEPKTVLALAGNYRSHLNDEEIPPLFQIPQPFHKGPACLVGDGDPIIIPKDSPGPVHFEAELVIVIGKTARDVSESEALDYVFGVTCGNDVSERFWQNDEDDKDVQWWRAKGADTFGPVGPCIASGLDYDNLMLRLRLNGEVMQEESTALMIHDVAKSVSFISDYVTLEPGDLIFTGTPGQTSAIQPGDVVEVELEGVGVLRNPVIAEE